MPLHEQAVNALRAALEAACSDPTTGVPGAVAVVVDKNGDELFSHAAGRRGVASSDKMTTDSVFWIASCTKVVTGIACMQLVEKGVLRLDDGEQVEHLCPELKTLKVLRADGTLEAKNKDITLRMLLTHTAGFTYSFFNPTLRNHAYPAGVDEFSGLLQDFIQPLVFQPGERWEYGVSRDRPSSQDINELTISCYMAKDWDRLGWDRPGESHRCATRRLHEGQHLRAVGDPRHLHAPLSKHDRKAGVYEPTTA